VKFNTKVISSYSLWFVIFLDSWQLSPLSRPTALLEPELYLLRAGLEHAFSDSRLVFFTAYSRQYGAQGSYYDDPTPKDQQIYFELTTLIDDLLAVDWFDRFGIQGWL